MEKSSSSWLRNTSLRQVKEKHMYVCVVYPRISEPFFVIAALISSARISPARSKKRCSM